MEIRYDRLQKVADHLKKSKLSHARFDFGVVHTGSNIIQAFQGYCGSSGCALGELPAIFPEHFELHMGNICFLNHKHSVSKHACAEFFGLNNQAEFGHLFYPKSQEIKWLSPNRNGLLLGNNASKFEVAENIEHFIANKGFRKQAQESDVVKEATNIISQN